jgi:CubicO group peptidase (beta-lactamase class C family)
MTAWRVTREGCSVSNKDFPGAARAIIAAVALAVSAAPALAQDPARMDQVVRAAVDSGEFSGSVLVARGGEVLFDRGYGLANREWGVPNAGDTRFRIASVTKQFTAAAVMLLSDRGQVDVNAPVKTYLPDAPAAWDGVTVRHLLNHTSGVPNFTGFEDYAASKTRPTTPAELIARFRDRPLDFQPGERWAYSNSGYVLLTAIIERVGGKPYAEFVTENLFQPLGMTDSGYDSHATVLPRRASGYSPGPGGVVNAEYLDMSVPQGAGGLYSTTRDLLKWEQGLFGGRLLSAASLEALTTPARNDYAMGLRVAETEGDTIISHNGGIEGFNTYLGYETGDKLTVVVLGNLNGVAPDRLGTDLMTLARGGAVTLHDERQAIAVPADALRAYEGVFEASPSFAITMSVMDGKLMTQATGQQMFELFPEGPDAFFLKEVDAQVVFTRDAAGAVDGMVLHQGGRQLRIRKK